MATLEELEKENGKFPFWAKWKTRFSEQLVQVVERTSVGPYVVRGYRENGSGYWSASIALKGWTSRGWCKAKRPVGRIVEETYYERLKACTSETLKNT
jgi:IS4 transposase